MACPIEKARREQLEKAVSGVWDYSSILYIGANPIRFHYADQLQHSGAMLDVIEIDQEACDYLAGISWVNKVIQGDMREYSTLVDKEYELILWSHGPEIIEREYFESAMQFLMTKTKEVLVLMVPWGRYNYTREQFEKDKYPNITALYEDDFHKLGFQTSVLGEINVNGSNLLAWKYNEVSE